MFLPLYSSFFGGKCKNRFFDLKLVPTSIKNDSESNFFTPQLFLSSFHHNFVSPCLPLTKDSSSTAKPKKGDYKISWRCIGKNNDEVSLLGKINDNADEMVSYVTELRILWSKFTTDPLGRLWEGKKSLSSMVESLRTESKVILWVLRVVLFAAIIGGAIAFVGPLSYLLDQIPCIGDFLSGIIDFFAGVAGFLWSLLVCVLCWCLVRPWLLLAFGIVLVVCIGAIIAYKQMKPKKSAKI